MLGIFYEWTSGGLSCCQVEDQLTITIISFLFTQSLLRAIHSIEVVFFPHSAIDLRSSTTVVESRT